MRELKLTTIDSNQIPRYTYSENDNAQRVVIVGAAPVMNITSESQPSRIEYIPVTTVEKIEVPVIVKELEIKTIEIPVLTIQKEVQIVELEKTIVVTEYKTIEVPVIVREKEIVYLDRLNYKMVFIMQAITLALILLSKFK